jgi:hypothetical protein
VLPIEQEGILRREKAAVNKDPPEQDAPRSSILGLEN